MNFIRHFFWYVTDTKGTHSFEDGLGKGIFLDPRHYIIIVITILACVFFYQFAKRKPQIARKTINILFIYLLIARTYIQVSRVVAGCEHHILQVLPFHLCCVLVYTFPICYFLKLKKILPSICVLNILGGILAVGIGQYYNNRFMNFYDFESIIAHIMLISISFALIGLKDIKFDIKKIYQPFIFTTIICLWAALGNNILFKDSNPNYMYLSENILPGNIGGKYFIFVYIIGFSILISSIYLIQLLIDKHNEKRHICTQQ